MTEVSRTWKYTQQAPVGLADELVVKMQSNRSGDKWVASTFKPTCPAENLMAGIGWLIESKQGKVKSQDVKNFIYEMDPRVKPNLYSVITEVLNKLGVLES